MTVSTGKRAYRACERCRRRKIKCDLISVGEESKPPCLECHRIGRECTLSASRRGGDYSHRRRPRREAPPGSDLHPAPILPENALHIPVALEEDECPSTSRLQHQRSDSMSVDELRNPSDALRILARAATPREHEGSSRQSMNKTLSTVTETPGDQCLMRHTPDQSHTAHVEIQSGIAPNRGIATYKLVAQGFLDSDVVQMLINLYTQKYHDFLPIVPMHVLKPSTIDDVARDEPFLLTAILTIASKDDEAWSTVHRRCWDYLQELLLDVLLARPQTHRIGLVEGLLLLADWLPPSHNRTSTVSKTLFAEDATAWSLIGQAVRHAYLLRLDRTSFRNDFHGESKDMIDRKRLVWTFVYIADRQISVRLGQAFWSRGPSLSSKFTAKDFPTLQNGMTDVDDQASVLQATMELTQLLHNAHDILYSSRARTQELILAGDYNRYLDDFEKALTSWDDTWHNLALSPRIKCMLTLMYEYVCLYSNAFAFQARVTQVANADRNMLSDQHPTASQQEIVFPCGIMATPEGRYIFEALRAAKAVLRVISRADPVSCLRYMPTRYHLYAVYSAVFLYKANDCGSLPSSDEQEEVLELLQSFINGLEQAATTHKHVGWRYSRMLKVLIFAPSRTDTSANGNPRMARSSRRYGRRNDIYRDSAAVAVLDVNNAMSTNTIQPASHEPSSTTDGMASEPSGEVSVPPESDTDFYDGNAFDLENVLETDSLLETLFGIRNTSFVPPFSDELSYQ